MTGDLRLYARLLREARPYWAGIAGVVGLSVLAAPLALLIPVPLKIAVDSVIGSRPLPGALAFVLPGSVQHSRTGLLVAIAALLVVFALLQGGVRLATSVLQAWTGERLVLDFRAKLFDHVQRLSLVYHDTQGTSDAIYRIQYDALAIQKIAVDAIAPLVTAVFTVVGMLVVTAALDWQLALVALAVSPVLVAASLSYRRHVRPRWRNAKQLETSALAVVQEVLTGLRVVRAFGGEAREQQRFVRRSADGVRVRVRITLAQAAFGLSVALATAIATAVVLYVGVTQVRHGSLTLGSLLLVMSYLTALYEPLETASNRTASLQGALANAERAFALLDERVDVPERRDARRLPGRARGALALRNVSFEYEPGRRAVDRVSLDVPAGTRVAIAGSTGAGKSTLVSLLMRFYDPVEGSIALDGTDLRELRLDDLRRQFAIVLQEPVLFSTSIGENIAYARPDATPEEVRAAARAAHADEFISALPEGYETVVGERGVRLSGGERQRISLARAFLKDAPILILDEATSSVDVRTEALILDAMERLVAGRTTFVIAHRLGTLQDCDIQLQLEHGRVAGIAVPRAIRWGRRRTDHVPARSAGGAGERGPAEPLERLLEGGGGSVPAPLRTLLDDVLGAGARVSVERVQHRVYRIASGEGDGRRSVVAKQVTAQTAERARRLHDRWLPAAGLSHAAAALLGSAGDPEGRWVWQLHEDLGDRTLAARPDDERAVGAVVDLVAELHGRFAGHPLLPECRLWLGERGARFLEANALDALRSLEAILDEPGLPDARRRLSERAARHVRRLVDELPERTAELEALGGPETLLHGDPWTTNAFVLPDGRARLIDWERAAVGPAAYDLGVVLYRFPAVRRPGIVAAYRRALRRIGLELPDDTELARAIDSGERARILTRVVWPAAAVLTDEPEWGWSELETVEEWFDRVEPVLAP